MVPAPFLEPHIRLQTRVWLDSGLGRFRDLWLYGFASLMFKGSGVLLKLRVGFSTAGNTVDDINPALPIIINE